MLIKFFAAMIYHIKTLFISGANLTTVQFYLLPKFHKSDN